MRTAIKVRETKETKVEVELNLDSKGEYSISTGIKFFDHMLEQFSLHSGCGLKLNVVSYDKDAHHVVEDIALTLGDAIKEALGDKKGVFRYGEKFVPMDEALVLSVIDLSGRAFCRIDAEIAQDSVSDFEIAMLPHFFSSLAQASLSTIHIKLIHGSDPHHIIEAVFKSFAGAFGHAVSINEKAAERVPSSKGIL